MKTKPNKKRILLIFGFCLALFLSFNQIAKAATKYWDGEGTTNNWSEAANWDADTLPTTTDDIIFDTTSTKDCTLDTTATITQYNSLILDTGYTGTLTMNQDSINGTDTFKVTTDITVREGTIVLTGDPTAINAPAGGTASEPYGEGMTFGGGEYLR